MFYVNTANWTPFAPYGLTGVSFFGNTLFGQTGPGGEPIGMLAGAAVIFFAYIGFDSVSTHAEEAKNPKKDVFVAGGKLVAVDRMAGTRLRDLFWL